MWRPLKTLLLCQLILSGGAIYGQNIEQLVDSAETSERQVLLLFSGSDWCASCIKLKETVLHTAEFNEFVNEHFIFKVVDLPRNQKGMTEEQIFNNELLASEYDPQGVFPLFVLIDPSKQVKATIKFKGEGSTEMLAKIRRSMQ